MENMQLQTAALVVFRTKKESLQTDVSYFDVASQQVSFLVIEEKLR